MPGSRVRSLYFAISRRIAAADDPDRTDHCRPFRRRRRQHPPLRAGRRRARARHDRQMPRAGGRSLARPRRAPDQDDRRRGDGRVSDGRPGRRRRRRDPGPDDRLRAGGQLPDRVSHRIPLRRGDRARRRRLRRFGQRRGADGRPRQERAGHPLGADRGGAVAGAARAPARSRRDDGEGQGKGHRNPGTAVAGVGGPHVDGAASASERRRGSRCVTASARSN